MEKMVLTKSNFEFARKKYEEQEDGTIIFTNEETGEKIRLVCMSGDKRIEPLDNTKEQNDVTIIDASKMKTSDEVVKLKKELINLKIQDYLCCSGLCMFDFDVNTHRETAIAIEMMGFKCVEVLSIGWKMRYVYDIKDRVNIEKALKKLEPILKRFETIAYFAQIYENSMQTVGLYKNTNIDEEVYNLPFGDMTASLFDPLDIIIKEKKSEESRNKITATKSHIAPKHTTESYIYVLKCHSDIEEFYKIGKSSSKNMKKRYPSSTSMPYKYDILYLQKVDDSKVFEIEKELHNLHCDYTYSPNVTFCGHTECFSEINVGTIEAILKGDNNEITKIE